MDRYLVSIIIPVLNEAAIVGRTLEQLQQYSELEVIVVDGGSQDNTVAIAQRREVKVIAVTEGRAAQMNAGANIAQGDILLFLHADTQLPPNFVELVIETLDRAEVIAGAFELTIVGKDRSLRWIEMLVKMRSHLLSLPYGDQAIFIPKSAFSKLGGFANLPIMEDFEFIKRARKQGKIAIAPAAVITSGRRWQKLGIWQTTLVNQLIITGYYLGVSPQKLSNFYRSRGNKK